MDKIKSLATKAMNKDSTSSGTTDTTTGTTTTDKGDYLDQGVGMAGKQSGHTIDRAQEEKISDGLRTGYTKISGGKEVPITDQN